MIRRLFAALILGAGLGLAAPIAAPILAQEAVNPTALSVQEEKLLESLGPGDSIRGRITIPAQSAADLEKPTNKDWMWVNTRVSDTLLVAAIVVTVLAILLFHFTVGRQPIDKGRKGLTIQRFAFFERLVHWTMATSFVVLALSGLNVAIGRYVVMPLAGEDVFGTVTYFGKLAHHYLAWPFMLCVVFTFVMWVRHNIPSKLDLAWFKAGGGLLKNGAHPAAKKFNAGQKIVFWGVIVGGSLVALSGLVMMFPFLLDTASQWQIAQIAHALIAAGMTALIIGHIYIGTAGSEGALEAMTTGQVDVNWAEQHHSIWLKEELAKGVVPKPTPGQVSPAE